MMPLAAIGSLPIPPGIEHHRFMREARTVTKIVGRSEDGKGVVGTVNTRRCELYGWERNVEWHFDRTGIVYAVPLLMGMSVVWAQKREKRHTLTLSPGLVFRLDDYALHRTRDTAAVTCAFVGSFKEPCDAEAMQILKAGIAALAEGAYYGAPRVGPGFRAMMPDECYVHDFETDDVDYMLLDDARKQDKTVIQCADCEAPAVAIDHHFPWHQDMNRCQRHLSKQEAT